ncbi:MAG TPA: phage holin family protein [Acidimicrobiales bacterium]|nr:phage holin family protein [Acidimicrobiales bacterium]
MNAYDSGGVDPRGRYAGDQLHTDVGRRPVGGEADDRRVAGGDVEDASLGELFSNLTSDLGDLLRSEMELAKVEMKEEAVKAGRAGGLLGGAAAAGYLALILLAFAAAWGLAELVDAGWAFLIVGVVVGAIAAVLARVGQQKLSEVNPVPEQTVETLKEDARWARAQTK